LAKKLTYCVYAHTNKINGKKYIGITCQKPEARWGINGSRYLYEDSRTRSAFAEAIRKYGWENFTHEILYVGLTEAEAKQKEKELIAQYRTYIGFKDCMGYNMTLGGDGAALYETEEARAAAIKASTKKSREKLNASEEYREKMRKWHTERAREYSKNPEWRAAKSAYSLEYYHEHKDRYLPRLREQSHEYYHNIIKNDPEAKAARNAARKERREKIKSIRKQLMEYANKLPEAFTEEEKLLIFEKYPGTNCYKCEHLPKLTKLLENALKFKTCAV
jgi:hypothetical protein